MCFGIPGKIIERTDGPLTTGTIQYGAVTKRCSLMYLPEAEIGDYVLVQNKIAMTLMNEEEAQECIDELNANDLLTDLPQ